MGKNNNNTGQLFAAAVAGAAVGAALAVLYTPQSGKATRIKIKGATARASNSLLETAEALSASAKDSIDSSNDSLGYLIGTAIAKSFITFQEITEIVKNKLLELESGTNIVVEENEPLVLLEDNNSH